MTILTANDLKVQGVSGIEKLLQNEQEVVISVRGKPRYVVMEIAQYEHLRERELEAAWFQTREDVAAGRYRQESAEQHLIRVQAELNDGL
jgi:PHD/YefM family antitoxin component YafN of YafNO toxin-antitoxin module